MNPAIDKTGGADNQPSNPQTSDTKAMALLLGNRIGVEARRVVDHVGESNFINWMEAFYSTWETKLADTIEQLGGDREIATSYCAESKRRLLDACDCKAEQLAESIANCVKSWPNRVNQLIEEMQLCLK